MTNLQLTAYKPNFNDPRVKRRTCAVLEWVGLHLSTTSPEAVHHDKLKAVFGSASNGLSSYLRANLLIKTGSYIVGVQSYSYLLNKRGYNKLCAATHHKLMVTTSADAAPASVDPEIASLDFIYALKSDRYWHPLQNIKREHKTRFWAPHLPHNYDIQACAPTVLFQLAVQAGLSEILLRTLRSYLDDRDSFRAHVAALAAIPMRDAKRLINSLFNGARLSANHHCSTYRLINHDREAMRRLQHDKRVKSLVTNIRSVWSMLELVERNMQAPTLDQVMSGTAKPFKKKLKTSRQKWRFYFKHERKILEAITEELRRAGIKYFTEHDGFRTDREISLAEVEAAVTAKTGFAIKLQKEKDAPEETTHHHQLMVTTSGVALAASAHESACGR